MANDKINKFEDGFKAEVGDSAVRARNRTVMLTPEITGEVRARLSRSNNLEERHTTVLDLPEQEGGHVVAGPEKSASSYNESVDETIYAATTATGYYDTAPSGRPTTANGPNPISRETHKLQNSLEHNREIESSLPRPEPVQVKPVFAGSGGGNGDESASLDPQEDNIIWTKITPIVGFLVSYDNDPHGQVMFIRSGRVLVSSAVPNGGNFLYLNNESVSPMHAILRVTEDSQIQVLDNLSEFGTTIIRAENGEEVTLSGEKAMIHHGDLLRFGKRTFSVCLIGR